MWDFIRSNNSAIGWLILNYFQILYIASKLLLKLNIDLKITNYGTVNVNLNREGKGKNMKILKIYICIYIYSFKIL